MEKYSRWRASWLKKDAGTGIQPFLPPVPPKQPLDALGALRLAASFAICPIIAFARLLMLALLALLHLVLVDAVSMVLPGAVARLWKGLLASCLCRLALFVCGFYYIPTEMVSLRRGRGHATRAEKWDVKSGDVIIANWSSYVDVLYLQLRFAPVFTQCFQKTNTLRMVSFWEAIRLTGAVPELEPRPGYKTSSMSELVQHVQNNDLGPIVVFPEGTTSNGKALLKFLPLFQEYHLPLRHLTLRILSLRYDYHHFSPTFSAGTKWTHIFRLCSQFQNALSVRYLASSESPSSPSFTPNAPTTASSTTINTKADLPKQDSEGDVVGAQTLLLLGALSRLRRTGMGVIEKRAFLEYFAQMQSGYAKKK
ncbi:hypothetical protein BZG36_02425 [Bifiguratus adelaidae]|uniref:Phospholipid/glycerol acyltransferase domain-containing protein n=1 Tax=Bifiguratus adelaidae TaxID=1938954 RepID=A0A261Y3L6_9FUNG|nr:hypothetical protein BZG36_02425 [Bifiguratus adelaidae]